MASLSFRAFFLLIFASCWCVGRADLVSFCCCSVFCFPPFETSFFCCRVCRFCRCRRRRCVVAPQVHGTQSFVPNSIKRYSSVGPCVAPLRAARPPCSTGTRISIMPCRRPHRHRQHIPISPFSLPLAIAGPRAPQESRTLHKVQTRVRLLPPLLFTIVIVLSITVTIVPKTRRNVAVFTPSTGLEPISGLRLPSPPQFRPIGNSHFKHMEIYSTGTKKHSFKFFFFKD